MMADELSLDNILDTMKSIKKTGNHEKKLSVLDEYYAILQKRLTRIAVELNDISAKIGRHQTNVSLFNMKYSSDTYAINNLNIKSNQLKNKLANITSHSTSLQNMLEYVRNELFDDFTKKEILYEDIHSPQFIAYITSAKDAAYIKQDLLEDKTFFILPIKKNTLKRALKNIDEFVDDGYNVYNVTTLSRKLELGTLANLTQVFAINKFNSNNPHNLIVVSDETVDDQTIYAPEKQDQALEAKVNPNSMVYI